MQDAGHAVGVMPPQRCMTPTRSNNNNNLYKYSIPKTAVAGSCKRHCVRPMPPRMTAPGSPSHSRKHNIIHALQVTWHCSLQPLYLPFQATGALMWLEHPALAQSSDAPPPGGTPKAVAATARLLQPHVAATAMVLQAPGPSLLQGFNCTLLRRPANKNAHRSSVSNCICHVAYRKSEAVSQRSKQLLVKGPSSCWSKA